ncbi:hypothetical protein CC80DRAFT_568643 [Byssothecium circinans]|uniref:Uncharacterized protein n=1 Tax=Byssothecium circinans TaxID=147558 RepID=A0A6A5TXK7_9PLEO|nr:hypothetical protein CC80DRAFT_568643 [Byssothecium circinans]
MDEIESTLTEARRLRALGQLKQAATRLESVSATWRDPRLLSERADVLISQGYWAKALGVLEELKIEGHQANSDLFRARIQMQLCFVRPVVEASFGQSMETAKGLHSEYLLGIDWSHTDRNLVMMESYFFRAIHLAKMFRMIDPPHLTETAAVGIQSCFAAILTRGMYEDAYSIASDFHHLQDGPTSNALLRALLNGQKTPPLVKAKVMRDLAQSRKLENVEADPDDLETTARDIFIQSGHVHGALDIDFNRACRSLKSGAGSIDDH